MKRELKKLPIEKLTIALEEEKLREVELRDQLKEARELLFKASFRARMMEEVLKERKEEAS